MQQAQLNYRRTLRASYTGYITQAIVNNLAPLLFVTFQKQYHMTLGEIGMLVTCNFVTQMVVDLLSAKFVDKIGYKPCIVTAHVLAALGLVGLAAFPAVCPTPFAGLLCAILIYAVGGGLIEVLISPIVEALPTAEKSTAMSMLHSFYCWGQVAVILLSTLYFATAGLQNWRLLPVLWAVVPALNVVQFAGAPVRPPVEAHEALPVRRLFCTRIFWVFAVLMICAGASELAMSQWASLFAETGLRVPKAVGDLLGPCLFAALMGLSRTIYGKWGARMNLRHVMALSAALCVCSYLLVAFSPWPFLSLAGCGLCGLSVGILWPGTFSLAARGCPQGGTAMFAFFATAGDIGCTLGPALVGFVSGSLGGNLHGGLGAGVLFPVLTCVGILLVRRLVRPLGPVSSPK